MEISNQYIRSYPSIYRGVVERNDDPENLGRCKIRVPSVHGRLTYPVDILPWARPIVLSPVGTGRGSVHIPDVGDIVWVLFEGAIKDFPIYLGGTYATGDLEINPNIIDFYIEGNDRISYDRDTRNYDIKIGDRHIIVTPENIIIEGDLLVHGKIVADGDVIGNNISLDYHTHGGVERGLSSTNAPNS